MSSLTDVLDRQSQEIEDLRKLTARYAHQAEDAEAENDLLRRDRERLDWVIEKLGSYDPNTALGEDVLREWVDDNDARDAIDAAIQAEKEGE